MPHWRANPAPEAPFARLHAIAPLEGQCRTVLTRPPPRLALLCVAWVGDQGPGLSPHTCVPVSCVLWVMVVSVG